MDLSYQTIKKLKLLHPMEERTVVNGLTYGLSSSGYDIRIAQTILMWPGRFVLASSKEQFLMPNNVSADVKDKSTWIRRGISVHNTYIEAGWAGYLTLELKNEGFKFIKINKGDPIAQIVFHFLDEHTEKPYVGKYQRQQPGPQPARAE